MPKVMKISEAASLGLHSMVFLASRPEKIVSIKKIGTVLHASQAHLSKVLQRLARAGLVRSSRGPRGGFMLARPGDQITLLEVYEAIEGPLVSSKCLFDTPICTGKQCIFGDLLETTSNRYRAYLEGMKLSKLTEVYVKEAAHA